MRYVSKSLNLRLFMRLAASGMAAALLAGCSSDASRLSAFSNPFASQADHTPTASIPEPSGVPSSGPILSRQLAAPPKAASLYSVPAKVSPRTAYNAPAFSAPATTSSIARPAITTGARAGGWSADGGTPVVVAQGETSAMLARRYGVPEDALLRVNGFGAAAQVQPGSRLVVPVFNGNVPQAAGQRAAISEPVKAASIKPAPHVFKQTLAKAQPVKQVAAAKPAMVKAIAAKTPAAAKTLAIAKPVAPKKIAAKAPEAVETTPVKVAKLQKPVAGEAKPVVVDKTPVASLPPPTAPVVTADAPNPEFRWPARGRVIQGFKSGGNDGINIAVPEGTSVKAAEGGVVAYAGSELKGYGNLVLIRHPNGFVSAYANNGEIDVKRGDAVKRGQTIAKSGQSGNVSSPQLHFELRKGSTPVDPTNYLAGL